MKENCTHYLALFPVNYLSILYVHSILKHTPYSPYNILPLSHKGMLTIDDEDLYTWKVCNTFYHTSIGEPYSINNTLLQMNEVKEHFNQIPTFLIFHRLQVSYFYYMEEPWNALRQLQTFNSKRPFWFRTATWFRQEWHEVDDGHWKPWHEQKGMPCLQFYHSLVCFVFIQICWLSVSWMLHLLFSFFAFFNFLTQPYIHPLQTQHFCGSETITFVRTYTAVLW